MSKKWRMDSPCKDCPFNKSGPGAFLRQTLGRSRMDGIKKHLRSGGHFTCHKTTDETGNGSNLMCAGAIEWQNSRGVDSNLQRIMERLDAMFAKSKVSA